MVSVTQQGKKTFVLKTMGVVATRLISHFDLAEVHHQKHTSNTSAMHRVLCLEVGGRAGIIARGCRQMASSAAHQHPPFFAGYICPTSTLHCATSLFVCGSKGLRYLQIMLLSHHMPTFATQLPHVNSLRR